MRLIAFEHEGRPALGARLGDEVVALADAVPGLPADILSAFAALNLPDGAAALAAKLEAAPRRRRRAASRPAGPPVVSPHEPDEAAGDPDAASPPTDQASATAPGTSTDSSRTDSSRTDSSRPETDDETDDDDDPFLAILRHDLQVRPPPASPLNHPQSDSRRFLVQIQFRAQGQGQPLSASASACSAASSALASIGRIEMFTRQERRKKTVDAPASQDLDISFAGSIAAESTRDIIPLFEKP